MKIEVNYLAEQSSLVAHNYQGQSVVLTPSKEGSPLGMSPMQMVLVSLASCSAPDLVEILRKQRQKLQRLSIELEATRVDAVPAIFKNIHLHYNLEGEIAAEKAERAIKLALEKYCSVASMLSDKVKISTSFSITHNTSVEPKD